MKFFNVKSQTEVLDILSNLAVEYSLGSEKIATKFTLGRILSESVLSGADVPSFNRSTVDGYAIVSSESHGATDSIPGIIDLVGTIEMGKEVNYDIKKSETMYIPTGGMLPDSADGVIMIEDTELLDDNTVCLKKSIAIGDNIIYKGDDIKNNTTALPKFKKITALDIGVLSALGITEVSVFKKITVSIFSTGDEIIDIDQVISLGQIYDINSYVLENLVTESGGLVINKQIIPDDYDSLFNAVNRAADDSDIVLLSGGSSVGTRDYTYDVINSLENSKIDVQGISIKPGKPTIIGKGKGKLIIGLPGHPVSSIIVYKAFIDIYMRRLLHQPDKKIDFIGTLTQNIHSSPGKTTYQLITLKEDETGYKVVPKYGKSGMISLLASATGYIIIDDFKEGLNSGEIVKGYFLG
ncbi:MAG: molybdopterin molybdotransferase MoeA [Spirochaetaceae bacterium]